MLAVLQEIWEGGGTINLFSDLEICIAMRFAGGGGSGACLPKFFLNGAIWSDFVFKFFQKLSFSFYIKIYIFYHGVFLTKTFLKTCYD